MILEISVAIIAFFVVVFVIGLLIVLFQIRRTAIEAEKLLDTTRQHIAPLSHDLAIIFNDVKKIVESIKGQVEKVDEGVSDLREAARRISEFEKMLQEKLEKPIVEFSALFTAIAKLLRSLVDFWKR
ncbi:MAG: DUF948 domain-containing protein [Candidatus Zhuqueibacterota bacterium]